MHIEQIIEFKLRGPEPPVVHVLLQLVIFMIKEKSPRKIFEWITIYCWNIAESMYLAFPYVGKSLPKFNPKMQDFKRVLDLNC